MEVSGLVERVQELTDVELAILLGLIAGQHCIIQTEKEALSSLEQEIQLIASNIFGLSHSTVQCNESTTLDDLSNGVLVDIAVAAGVDDNGSLNGKGIDSSQNPFHNRQPSSSNVGKPGHPGRTQNDHKLANVVILTDLHLANYDVQIQTLELLRTNRIFTHTTLHAAPKLFLIVALNSIPGPCLVSHLNDHMFISHYHDLEDGFSNLEEGSEWIEDDRASLSSVVHRSAVQSSVGRASLFAPDDIRVLTELSSAVTVSAEVKAYLQNIVTFLRMNRAVRGGISPRATKHFDLLVKCLAPLHGLDYVTPSLVALAARKIYPHRIVITTPEDERSMQYGSDLAAVTALLEGITPEAIMDEVLASVEAPL